MSEPVSLPQFVAHNRLTDTLLDSVLDTATGYTEGDYVSDLITAARAVAEHETDRTLIPKTLVLRRHAFPCDGRRWIELPYPPARSVTSIEYIDADGATQTWSSSNYLVKTDCEPARVYLAAGADWPSTEADTPNSVIVTFTAGYASAADVGRTAWLAVLWLASWWYEQRLPVNVGNLVTGLPRHLEAILPAAATFLIYGREIASVTETAAASVADADFAHLFNIVGLTGGGVTKLDGQDTVTVFGINSLVVVSYGNTARMFKLHARTSEVEDGENFIIPDDNSALVWEKIGGP